MLLALATAHRACSIALLDRGEVTASVHEEIGRGHAERLLPMLADLLGERRPDEIAVEVGPGSFTGIRVGIAAARALGLAWRVPVYGMTSTALLAAEAYAREPALTGLSVVLDGGRGEVFRQDYEERQAGGEILVVSAGEMPPLQDAAIGTGTPLVAIGGAAILGAYAPAARAAALLSPEERGLPPRPLYIRPPDAKPAAA